MQAFSLIWSENDSRTPFPDYAFIDDLKLTSLIRLSARPGALDLPLGAYFTQDRDTIALRGELFAELLDNRTLYHALVEQFGKVADIQALGKLKSEPSPPEQSLYSIREIELYTQLIKGLQSVLTAHSLRSRSLIALRTRISEIHESEAFAALCKSTAEQSHTVTHAQSITVGINLNAQLTPTEAGIVSINEERYESGSVMQKLLRLDFKEDEYTCLTPLQPITKGLTPMEAGMLHGSFNHALWKLFASAISSWTPAIRKYVLTGTDWLFALLPEIEFIRACTDHLIRLSTLHLPLCLPNIQAQGEKAADDHAMGLYNPLLALASENGVVQNDLSFDAEGAIFILTGPNQGGKSVYTVSVGLLYSYFHLGLPLPCNNAQLTPLSGIFTHFSHRQEERKNEGRFATECARIAEISRSIDAHSLFLFDEALSSTGGSEAGYIAREILSAYAVKGARGIFTTHLHELCGEVDAINADPALRSRLCNLSAELDRESHARKFTIRRGSGAGLSYALDIARKYRLTRDMILEK